jgi:hypothetical protein
MVSKISKWANFIVDPYLFFRVEEEKPLQTDFPKI